MSDWEEIGVQFPRKMIVASFIVALLLSVLPLPSAYFFWLPDFAGMVLLFWVMNRPSNVNLGTAFVIGLLLDVLSNAPLGGHALAYLISTYLVLYRRPRIAMRGFGAQALIAGAALLLNQLVMAAVWGYVAHRFVGWLFFVPPLTAAMLWPLLNKLMLKIFSLQRRRS